MSVRLGLPRVLWLRSEAQCWDRVLLPRLRAHQHRDQSIEDYLFTYRLWLAHRRQHGRNTKSGNPLLAIDPSLGRHWVDDLRERVSASSRLTYLLRLKKLIITADPTADLPWLAEAICAEAARKKSTPPPDRLTPECRQVWQSGQLMLARAEAALSNTPIVPDHKAWCTLYRDGLILCLLTLRPFRLSNFARLRIDENITLRGGAAWFRFSASETKVGIPLEIPFPVPLIPALVTYILRVRPALAGARESPDLWLSYRGKPLTTSGVAHVIRAATASAVGKAYSSNAFRRAAVNFLAVEHPELIDMSVELLTHQTARVTQRHYNTASMATAVRAVQENLFEVAREQTHNMALMGCKAGRKKSRNKD